MSYDKPADWHLVHVGTVISYEPPVRFSWRAPFHEWPRARVGSDVVLTTAADGGAITTESLVFEVENSLRPTLHGFLTAPGLDADSFTAFLQRRLAGLARLLDDGSLDADPAVAFDDDRQIAADWAGRIADGEWTRILYADGEVDFDAPAEVAFNAFTRFSRYADWTREIHVG